MVKKKLRLRGWDLSGEIRAEILRSFPPGSCKTVGWRPNWCQKGVILGPLGFRAQLAHLWGPRGAMRGPDRPLPGAWPGLPWGSPRTVGHFVHGGGTWI